LKIIAKEDVKQFKPEVEGLLKIKNAVKCAKKI